MAGRRRGDDERINGWQGILDVRVQRDAVLKLPTAVTYLSGPLIDADRDSLRSRPHIPPPGCRDSAASIPSKLFLDIGSLAYCRMERHPRMSGRNYVRLGCGGQWPMGRASFAGHLAALPRRPELTQSAMKRGRVTVTPD